MAKKTFTLLTVALLILCLSYISSLDVDGSKVIGSKTETLYSISDTFVNSSSPDANYGNEVLLYVGASSEYSARLKPISRKGPHMPKCSGDDFKMPAFSFL